MPNTLFNRYKELAEKAEVTRGTKESLIWFQNRIRKDSRIRNIERVTDNLKAERPGPGKMMTYVYDPKFKDKLKFYDTHPLIIMLEKTNNGWYGANLHYLPPKLRVALLQEIEYNKRPLRQISTALEKNPLTRPCLKRYLTKQIRSVPVTVPKEEWEIAIQLPFESFVKEANKTVWRISEKGR